jgi:hypothetical protein
MTAERRIASIGVYGDSVHADAQRDAPNAKRLPKGSRFA